MCNVKDQSSRYLGKCYDKSFLFLSPLLVELLDSFSKNSRFKLFSEMVDEIDDVFDVVENS